MNFRYLYFFVICFVTNLHSQSVTDTIKARENEKPISFLDSIKATFKKDKLAAKVDSLWMNELNSTDLYDNLTQEIATINLDQNIDFELPTELLKERLKEMDAKSPFNIEYNVGLENLIKSFLKNRKKAYERLMGLSEFYFPMFEEALAKHNVPLEIKYLAIVESALNPKATSRVGAAGLWQFMYQTGKQYKLNIDSYVDERRDPVKSSDAAAVYLSKMYKIFGDWDLVLASYNSGPGNVSKAIRRSGGLQNFWNIKKHLPRETQGYVPAFLATMYIYEYHKEHGIVPNRAVIKSFETDTIMIKNQISFKHIADLMDVPMAQLQMLNPSYKTNVIPSYKNQKHALRLPSDKIAAFVSNEDKIYAYVEHQNNRREKVIVKKKPTFEVVKDTLSTAVASSNEYEGNESQAIATKIKKSKYLTTNYKVKKGDNITLISQRFGVSVAQIRKWNHLRKSSIPLGKNIRIYTLDKENAIANEERTSSERVSEKQMTASNENDNSTEKSDYYVVQKGDNLKSIAKKFGVSIKELKQWNNIETMTVNLDEKLRVQRGLIEEENVELKDKNTSEYIVERGDNLFFISKKLGVSQEKLAKWNNLSSVELEVGNKLVYLVDKKESKREVVSTNKKATTKKATQYLVQKGDSLFTIAKKAGVTISELKSWNNLKANQDEIRPGMKLKING
jgi:membrane-bound lytic murein transglycosylase D